MPAGGRREHTGNKGGRPKGTTGIKHATTINKDAEREIHRKAIAKYADRMIRSQVAAAIGIGHVFTRDKNGKYTRIEDESKVIGLLENGVEGTDFYIFMKDPSTAAFSDLMNRAFDKAVERQEVTGADGGPLVVKWKD